jgi:hypothetical protein
MDIKISLEELRKRKIFLAIPMYGGMCTGMCTKSIQELTVECHKIGIQLNSYFLFNESLITRARNYCVDSFLRSDCTHLLFIDADIGFSAKDVITLLALQSDDSEYDIIGAAYPKKNISWEKIKMAVDKGVADNDPNLLENYVGDYVFNTIFSKKQVSTKLDEPAEVLELGTGFMMIRKDAFAKYKKAFPNIDYKPDHVRSEDFNGTREIGMYFQADIDPDTRRYLSEDYWFCQNMRKAGGKVWLCPWMQLQHIGTYTFGGSLAALSSIGAHATADLSSVVARKNT